MKADQAKLYFVPLGRECGGYLDVLGLMPDASDREIGDADTKYRHGIEGEFKLERKALRERLDAGEFDKAMYETLVAPLEATQSDKLMKLNKLKEKVTKAQAGQREQGKLAGVRKQAPRWLGAAPEFYEGRASRVSFILRPRALPRVRPELLEGVQRRWVRGDHRGDTPDLPSARVATAEGPVDLAAFEELLVERDVLSLQCSDLLWSRLACTNAKRWSQEVSDVTRQIRDSRSRFTTDPQVDAQLSTLPLHALARPHPFPQTDKGFAEPEEASAETGPTADEVVAAEGALARDSYLDVLGIGPDESPAEVGRADVAHRRKISTDFKRARKAVKRRRKTGEIDDSTYDELLALLEVSQEDKLRELNRLRERFIDAQGEPASQESGGRRRRASRGRKKRR